MKYLKYIILSAFILAEISMKAQVIEAVLMDHNIMDLTADTKSRKDKDGNKCAIVKVGLDQDGATFSGNVVGDIAFNSNEYLVYLKPKTSNLKISLPGYKSIEVNFKDLGIQEVESRNTYQLIIDVKPYATSKEEIRIVNLLSEAERLESENKHYESYLKYREAASLGSVEAMYWEYVLVDEGYDKEESKKSSFELCRKAAESGDRRAQCDLGTKYLFGHGVAQNEVEGFRWFLESAKNGETKGACELAICYDNGNGVSQNKEEAAKWYLKAAQGGNPIAQCMLGSFYMTGQVFEKDEVKGSYWINRSALNNDAQGQFFMGHLYFIGGPVFEKDFSKALEWYRKSASQNYLPAIEELISMHNRGKIENADPNELTRLNDQKVSIKLNKIK